MPRGWYLAQGLFPLGYSSSDDEEGPCTLPNGRIVCGPHGLVQCHKCCTDYSFMDEIDSDHDEDPEDSEEDDADSDSAPATLFPSGSVPRLEMVRGTGLVFPSKFTPGPRPLPPMELFSGRFRFMNVLRCTYPNDDSKLLIMTDGACLNNGQANPKAGFAFFQGLTMEGQPLVVSNRLEKQGPWGDDALQSSNRAELRAVIAALRLRYWPGEGFKTVVVATDSEYVVEGSTRWAKAWARNGWRTRGTNGHNGAVVKNKDLWEALLGEFERAKENGLSIQFWKIPREWNMLADEGAKKAAAKEEAPATWMDISGLAI
ncbi:ribonuclease H1 [Cordyceps javanica]|uniref:ribonuclease H n=1 Tax=Cordyceps javanica TaxID=43265 RepID=A0A545UN90_9HYPO|nr:ribonuclease H1 [Cordyceps javanica]TQW02684.1 ribonuclease H1 [Cordyceps javanica]